MKHLNKLFIAVVMMVGLSSNAQDSNNPWAITVGVNATDGARVSAAESMQNQFSEYFNANDFWNIVPSISYVTVSKYVGGDFSFGVTGSFNKITKFVEPKDASGDYSVSNPGDLMYYGIDGVINYSIANLYGFLEPTAHVGGGYTFYGDNSAGTVNGGLGLNLWFNDFVGLSFRSTYKYSFDDIRPDMPTHIQHFAGLTFKFGGKDSDNDGIYDKDDACPEVAGLPEFNGCPDTDGDKIIDSEDECPDLAGPASLKGCPDTDGDGIADKNDDCPEVAGSAALKGCPDTDGDGIADKDDRCPNEKGPRENGGCPYLDKDGDGVLDKDDRCPDVAGTVANQGCPEITEEKVKAINDAAKNIFFETGTSKLTKESLTTLDGIAFIMLEHSDAKFVVEGHTDSVGSSASNLKLSQARADSVTDYLRSKGVNPLNLSSKGFGEDSPIGENKTAVGRAKNRRVDVKLIK